ncbi:hypothetical protein AJ78_07971 [Emergomyces pasteurianus Ep9510]|uniref:ATPase, vacuolar ER assembly factor, Vma12 n=1 Tax=Emergomyces pasteurianus Ep9510 TaxID=1447872 RepID=A0A1J9P4Z1_9EURO|nr:hypothetical protein AJ78_07971 [Emergomyces pasteurianus Ep9510]
MVLLSITPTIVSALNNLPASTRDELSLPTPTTGSAISHTQLITLSRHLLSNSPVTEKSDEPSNGTIKRYEAFTLNSLLKGTRVYIPPPPPKPEPTPEYLALKASLLAAAEANEYNTLLNPTSPHSSSNPPSRIWGLNDHPTTNKCLHPESKNENKIISDDDPLTPSLVLNILISILFTGFASYWALSNFRIPTFFTFTSSSSPSYPGAVSSQPARVFISIIVALLVGVAEVVVFALYLKKVELAKEREMAIVERKVVIGEFKVGNGDGKDDEGGVRIDGKEEKEEIWGKGVNGGARRRVKERWKGKDGDS